MKTIVRFTGCSHSCSGFFILAVGLCWFALSPALKAGCPNPPGVCGGQNTAVGQDSLFNVTTGVWNVGVGVQALFHDTFGNQNTAVGYQTLFTNVDGDKSTGIGSQALFNNTGGSDNVAVGFRTLFTNTMGSRNTGMGYRTLAFNDTGNDNTAVGWNALFNNRSGSSVNTAVGSQALLNNTTGANNSALGAFALSFNVSGNDNTAVGLGALNGNMGGSDNTATGAFALSGISQAGNFEGSGNTANGANALLRCRIDFCGSGSNNTAIGALAFSSGDADTVVQNNTVIGAQALPLPHGGNNNIAIGYRAGTGFQGPADNTIEIGNAGDLSDPDGTIRIGDVQTRAFIAGIRGVTTENTDAIPVVIDSAGQLGTMSSSQRYKHEIKPMDYASEAILALKPVTFEYKSDKTNAPQFGLIAEEVAKVNPALVLPDKEGKPYTVRYDAVNAMLLNEFLKEHRKVERLEASVASLVATVKEQAAQIQKVNAQLEVSKAAPQTVLNSQ